MHPPDCRLRSSPGSSTWPAPDLGEVERRTQQLLVIGILAFAQSPVHGRHQHGLLLVLLALELRHLRFDFGFIHVRFHGILERRVLEVHPVPAAAAVPAVIPTIRIRIRIRIRRCRESRFHQVEPSPPLFTSGLIASIDQFPELQDLFFRKIELLNHFFLKQRRWPLQLKLDLLEPGVPRGPDDLDQAQLGDLLELVHGFPQRGPLFLLRGPLFLLFGSQLPAIPTRATILIPIATVLTPAAEAATAP